MTRITIGLIDYGVGNHASVAHSLKELGFRVCLSDDTKVLNSTDVLMMPGVGAFPIAMKRLSDRGLVNYLRNEAKAYRPIIGICLGMQLLTTISCEHEDTLGLDIIPGKIIEFKNKGWHIGWNSFECVSADPMIKKSVGDYFYFNHSLCFEGSEEFQIARTSHINTFASIIRRWNVIGLQFHPEKSQIAGKNLLNNIILGLQNA